VQAITDVTSPQPLYMNDKVVLIGDALAGFRPHTVASTSQAAFDVSEYLQRDSTVSCELGANAKSSPVCLVDWLDGKTDRKEFIKRVMQYSRL